MTIKRYSIDYDAQSRLAVKQTSVGDFVSYADYEELKKEREALERELCILEAKCKGYFSDAAVALLKCDALAAENADLKSKLIFWDWNDPETSYDSPEEIAEAFSLNYNEEFTVMVAAKMPNRVYRVCESWESECKLELVGGAEVETPNTDAALAEIRNEARAEGAEPLVKALTVIANSEEIDGDTVVCDFSTLVSVAAGALRDHYAQQLRKESCKCSS